MTLPPAMIRDIESREREAQGIAQRWDDEIRWRNQPDRATNREKFRVRDERSDARKRRDDHSRFGVGFPDEPDAGALKDWSRHRAYVVGGIVARAGLDPYLQYLQGSSYCIAFGVPPPPLRTVCWLGRKPPSDGTVAVAVRKMQSARWWKRTARAHHLRAREAAAIREGQVHSRAGYAVSDHSIGWRKAMVRAAQESMNRLDAVRERDGERVAMTDIIKGSLANPRVRKAELGMRAADIERLMDARGWVGFVVHLTLESRFHAWIKETGKRNPKWNGSDPRTGQMELRNIWKLIRAKVAKHKIKLVGMRSAEPHHDGTPHWHMLIFCSPAHIDIVQKIIRGEALRSNPNEPGAQEHRCRIVAVDKNNGRSAAAYILKYIFKAIPGALTGDATTDEDGVQMLIPGVTATSLAERIVTWGWVWGIRQFQTFGPEVQVGIWREFRRLRHEFDGDLKDSLMETARRMVDEGQFANFCAFRELHPVFLERCNPDKGSGPFSKLTEYGAPAAVPILGIVMPELGVGIIALSRDEAWKIEPKTGCAELSDTGTGFDGTRTRTRVNKCNRAETADRKADRRADPVAEAVADAAGVSRADPAARQKDYEEWGAAVIWGAEGPPNHRLVRDENDLCNIDYKGRNYTSKKELRRAVCES